METRLVAVIRGRPYYEVLVDQRPVFTGSLSECRRFEQLHEDKEFRELSSAARDLKDAVTAPKRMFEDSVRNATSEFMREVDTVRTEVTGSVASPTDDLGGAPVRFEGLTNETKATPGPDAAFVSAPSGKSLFEQEAAKLGGA